jgi:HK97 family phage portal protein
MIIKNIFRPRNEKMPAPPAEVTPKIYPNFGSPFGIYTDSGIRVTAEVSKRIASAYRCGNILSDDIASMPFQLFQKSGRMIEQVAPNSIIRNMAYLVEVQPNRWMTPFIFKKTVIDWLIWWGNAYIWEPPQSFRELFILPADKTYPVFDDSGNLWYKTTTPNGDEKVIPWVEVTHLMINSKDGLVGRSVISFAADTMGRQLGAHETQNKITGTGLNPAAVLWVDGSLSPEARKKVKDEYSAQIRGSSNAGGVAVFDNKIAKFEPVTMKPSDAQFLETINATDAEIANFFGMPLYKLNMGKQSYQSNEQQNLDYLRTTLNPYLVQWEQVARIRWLKKEEQERMYFRFIREAILQTDAKTRAEVMKHRITTGQMTPNEARQIEDLSAYPGGDAYYFPSNMAVIQPDGSLVAPAGFGSGGKSERTDENS